MQSKVGQIREAWMRGDKLAALKIAAKFFDRSEATRIMQRGWQAHVNPRFFAQVGKDPKALTNAALETLARKFNLPA